MSFNPNPSNPFKPPQSPAPPPGTFNPNPSNPFKPPQSPAPPPGTTTGRDAGGNPISIPPQSGGGGGSSGGSSGSSQTNVVIRELQGAPGFTEVIINGQGTSVLPGQAEAFLRSRGISGGSFNNALAVAIAQDQAYKRQVAQMEAQRQAEAEKRRIEQLAIELRRQGAQQTSRITQNEQGQRIRITITDLSKIEKGKDLSGTVWKYENLDTGETRYRDYTGFTRRQGGGVDFTKQTAKESSNIQSELREAGLQPIVRGGQVVGFSSKDTGKSYSYTDKGIKAFNTEVQRVAKQTGTPTEKVGRVVSLATKGDEKITAGTRAVKNFVSNQLARTGINVRDTRVANFVAKTASDLKKKGIDNVKTYRNFAEKRRDNALSQMQSVKFDLRKPVKTVKDATRWVRNADKYITGRAITTAIDLGIATPQLVNQLRRAPLITILALPPAIVEGFREDWRTVRRGDPVGIVNVAVDYLVFGATFRIGTRAVSSTSRNLQRLLPGTKKLADRKIVVRKGKTPLILKAQTVKSSAKPLSVQARLAGKRVTAVTAQQDRLTSLLRSKRVIRKPIPGEANFPAQIKRTLAKFDAGKKLTNKEFANVNMWLRKNVAPNITLLERSLYLDPATGLRISRLALPSQKTATLRDVLRGNFRLLPDPRRPQILVFENAKIAKFPKALRTIERKLKAGKPLTTAETNKLIRWQVQTGSGQFKPIGSTIYMGGKELEVTLAPGEIIRQVNRLGRVFIEGRKVSIVSAEVYRPSRAVLAQMKKANAGKLAPSQVNKLNSFLSRQLGRRVQVETPALSARAVRQAGRMARRLDPNIPVLRVSGLGIRVLSRGIRGVRSSARMPTRLPSRTRAIVRRPGRTPARGRATRVSRLGRTTPRRPARAVRTARATRTTPRAQRRVVARRGRAVRESKKPVPMLRLKGFAPRSLAKAVPVYYVKIKVGKRIVNLTPRPLTLSDARDFLAYRVDNGLSRSAWFEPLGKARRVVSVPKSIKGYYSRNSRKLRPYKFRLGRKIGIRMGYIEKRRYFNDTPGERRAYRMLKGRQASPQTKLRRMGIRTRRITPARKRQLMRQLEKARAVRMRNLRRKKK